VLYGLRVAAAYLRSSPDPRVVARAVALATVDQDLDSGGAVDDRDAYTAARQTRAGQRRPRARAVSHLEVADGISSK